MSARMRRLVSVTIVVAAWSAQPAQGAVRNSTLELVDARSRVVEVRLERNLTTGVRSGTLGLLIRNRAKVRRSIRVRYTPSGQRSRFTVRVRTRPRAPSGRRALAAAGGVSVPVGARDILDLNITFVGRDARASAEAADGRLTVTSEPVDRRRVIGRALVLPVRGVRAEERLVTVSPKSVTLPLTLDRLEARWPLTITARDYGEAFVELRGPGAAALYGRGGSMHTVLRRDDGESVTVTLRVDVLPDNVARLVLPEGELDIDDPGRYTGSVPLGSGESAPTIALAVEAGKWVGWAVLAVVVGVILGRMVPPFLKRERLRRRGRSAIRDAVRMYSASRRGRREPASYDLDWLISPLRWQLRGFLSRPQDRPARVLRELTQANTDDELKQPVNAAVALRGRIERWAQAERAARGLTKVLESRSARQVRYPATSASRVVAESSPPPPATAAEGPPPAVPEPARRAGRGPTVSAVAVTVAVGVAIAAETTAVASDMTWLAALLAMAALIAAVAAIRDRSQGVAAVRFSKMTPSTDALEVLAPLNSAPKIDDEPAPADAGLRGFTDKCLRVERERRVLELALDVWRRQARVDSCALDADGLRRLAETDLNDLWERHGTPTRRTPLQFAELARDLRDARDELKDLERTYPPRIVDSWQWLPRITAPASWTLRALARIVLRFVVGVVRVVLDAVRFVWTAVTATFRGWFAIAEGVSELLTLSVPVIVYILTLYDGTWGDVTDFFTAFAVGFGGKVALDWGRTIDNPLAPKTAETSRDATTARP